MPLKELDEAKKAEEKLSKELQALTEKFTRAQVTIRSARTRIHGFTQDKDQVKGGMGF